MPVKPSYVVATPGHCHFDEDKARALANHGLLHFVAKGTRRGTNGVTPEQTRLNPRIGLVATAAARTLPTVKPCKAPALTSRADPLRSRMILERPAQTFDVIGCH